MRAQFLLSSVLAALPVVGQAYTVTGQVLDAQSKVPVEFATLWIEGSGMGTVTDANGRFVLNNVPKGKHLAVVRCMGYSEYRLSLQVNADMGPVRVYLSELTLALKEVTVTAERKSADAATAYTLNRTALDHMQNVSISDAMSLLPGEQTAKAKALTASQQVVTLRGESLEMGNPAFGTVIEMDGVRLSGNATATSTGGTDLRNVGSSNVERIEVVTGVPSVEYGDLTNGVVKIVTRKGKSPLYFDVSVRPNTQSYALSKGIDLGHKAGVVNLSYERVRSVSDIASPYNSYIRNAFGAKYSNTFHSQAGRSLSVDLSVNGNIGGQNTESDPDAFKETYSKSRDNALWSSLSFNYMLNSNWLSNLRWGLTFAYSDRLDETRTNKSASAVQPALHTTEEGYFVAAQYADNPDAPILLLPTGYWYVTSFTDSRPVNYTAYLKARWSHKLGKIDSNLLLGADWKGEKNLGRGQYYTDMSVAPTWREYRFDALPAVGNLAAYMEERISVPFRASQLEVKAGLRNDMTFISGNRYGTVSSLSPRISARYVFGERRTGFFRGATLRAGWGKAVKLPSFDILYPRESYVDRLAFAPGAMADGTTYYAYHTTPVQPVYNAGLKWQYSIMREVGTDLRFKGFRVSLSFFCNTMKQPYSDTRIYTPFDYKLTDQTALDGCPIPSADRVYTIDNVTGVVTVSDKTGNLPSQVLAYKVMKDLQSASMSINGSSSSRMGLEWVIDFDRIRVLNTSVRLDGKFYRYKGVDETVTPSSSSLMGSDGQPYRYIGYYVGGANNYNGFETRRLNTNLTLVTHVPKVRMIFSLRFEGTFLNTRQNLSEYSGGTRSYVLDSRSDYLPSAVASDIYSGENYLATYPLYYVSRDDMHTQIPFLEKFVWAYDNDRALYNELSKLVVKSNTGYMFRKQGYSPYFSANLNVTKEIGKYLTVSFFANNFFYSLQKVKIWQTGTEGSLYGSSLITPFNYGVSFKLKL